MGEVTRFCKRQLGFDISKGSGVRESRGEMEQMRWWRRRTMAFARELCQCCIMRRRRGPWRSQAFMSWRRGRVGEVRRVMCDVWRV